MTALVLVLSLLILGTALALDITPLNSWIEKRKSMTKSTSLRESKRRFSRLEEKSSSLSTRTLKNTRIIGGTTAAAGRYPYYAYVEIRTSDETFFCSATLIWEDILLSSAHCITNVLAIDEISLDGVDVYVGLESLNALDDAEFREVSIIIPNDSFNPETQENDVLLFKLATPIRNVLPVRMNFDSSVSMSLDLVHFRQQPTQKFLIHFKQLPLM
jgi:secreted trypsin-like serine protease